MKRWIDTHIHVSDYCPNNIDRRDILDDLLDIIDRSEADLRLVLSPDAHWLNRMINDESAILEANRFIYDLVRRAPDRLYGSCMINPNFLKESLKTVHICFEEWGFIQFGEMLQYMMKFKMDSDGVEELSRLAMKFDVPIQVHISTSGHTGEGPMGSGIEQLDDFLLAADRVPDAKYIIAHAVGTMKDDPPVVDGYLDIIEKKYECFPDNFWAEIREVNSPGVRSVLNRIPIDRIIIGTDWTTRIGPPFLPYGVVFGKTIKDNPYPPRLDLMINFLKEFGASDADIEKISFENTAQLLKI